MSRTVAAETVPRSEWISLRPLLEAAAARRPRAYWKVFVGALLVALAVSSLSNLVFLFLLALLAAGGSLSELAGFIAQADPQQQRAMAWTLLFVGFFVLTPLALGWAVACVLRERALRGLAALPAQEDLRYRVNWEREADRLSGEVLRGQDGQRVGWAIAPGYAAARQRAFRLALSDAQRARDSPSEASSGPAPPQG